jgi:hypothetical protein
MVAICSERGWLSSALQAHLLLQMLMVGSWGDESAPFLTLPHVTRHNLKFLLSWDQKTFRCLPELQAVYCNHCSALVMALKDHFRLQEIMEVSSFVFIRLIFVLVFGYVVVVLIGAVGVLTNSWTTSIKYILLLTFGEVCHL